MEDDELVWIEDGDIIFKEGSNQGTYSYYGWQDNLGLAFYGYIEGYKNSADVLVDKALEEGKHGRIDVLDTFIYPITFLYRQFMELCLKSIYLQYSEQIFEEKKKYITTVGHNLKRSWDFVKPLIIKHSETEEDRNYANIAEQYIIQMDEFDSTSFDFRYPIDKKVDLTHKTWEYIDLPNLKEKMERFYNYYIGVDGQISAHLYSNKN